MYFFLGGGGVTNDYCINWISPRCPIQTFAAEKVTFLALREVYFSNFRTTKVIVFLIYVQTNCGYPLKMIH